MKTTALLNVVLCDRPQTNSPTKADLGDAFLPHDAERRVQMRLEALALALLAGERANCPPANLAHRRRSPLEAAHIEPITSSAT